MTPRRGRELGEVLGRLEQQRVAALAEADHQDLVAGLGLLQRVRQHDQRMRGAGLAADGVQVVAHGLVGHAGLLGDAGGHARQHARHGEVGDVGGLARRSP